MYIKWNNRLTKHHAIFMFNIQARQHNNNNKQDDHNPPTNIHHEPGCDAASSSTLSSPCPPRRLALIPPPPSRIVLPLCDMVTTYKLQIHISYISCFVWSCHEAKDDISDQISKKEIETTPTRAKKRISKSSLPISYSCDGQWLKLISTYQQFELPLDVRKAQASEGGKSE